MQLLLSELQLIKADTRALKMSSIYDEIDSLLEDATLQKWSPERFLCQVLHKEVTNRTEIRKMLRVKQAAFPQKLYLSDLVRSELPADGQVALPVLKTLDFIKEGRNVVLYGNPGTGKTHSTTGLGYQPVNRVTPYSFPLYHICSSNCVNVIPV